MATLTESMVVQATLAETWDFYFDARGWPAWVDGFGAVESAEGYPGDGSALVWRSSPAGRGTVRERVLEHQPRRRHRIEFADPSSGGTLLTRFEVEGEGTRVALELDYRLSRGGPLTAITERLFVRGQVRQSLRRSLLRFKHEVEEVAHFAAAPAPGEPR
jgi:uncharacterized membrane protein